MNPFQLEVKLLFYPGSIMDSATDYGSVLVGVQFSLRVPAAAIYDLPVVSSRQAITQILRMTSRLRVI